MTLKGFNKIQEDIRQLKNVDRPQIVAAIATARDYGDLSENAEYHSAKDRQGLIESRLIDLEDKISRAEVIDVSKIKSDDVRFGATIFLIDHQTNLESKFQIVGSYEADIKNGLLPITSPLAKALISKKTGDSVEVSTPSGIKSYEISKIIYV